MEFELLVRHNQRSFFIKTSALLLVLVRVTGQMTRARLWYVINTDQGYRLDNKKVSSECHWLDDERLIPASHCYAIIVARWLEVLAGYTRWPYLTVIISGTILE